ncbi:MAG TPA: NADH-quinone oxidoreductase subunit L [Vicinamibacterales bacterium]|nr:NADH-quinone oxidoreductase subunit L [Vicinamibacterales bacterium]
MSAIFLLPLIGFVVNASLGRRLPKAVSGGLATGLMFVSFGVSLWAFQQMASHGAVVETLFTWIPSGDLQVPFSLRLDPLGGVMILVVTGVGSLIHLYSIGYMHEETDSEYARYFSYLNLFAAFMLVLVLGANFPVMFVGWEGVGLCSYLLIGFWFQKQTASDAGKKAFVVNRIGDFGFLLAMVLIFTTFGTLDFQEVAAASSRWAPEAAVGTITLATLLLFLGATGKSAQIPLYVWLPDAMEGPTPVSALIHAATMVTAGVYMIGRNAVLFSHAPITMEVVAVVGIATALMAGTIGLVQNDIKRVLAYSTVSQLGFMFLAMGVGAFAAGIFHLYTHAFFKALLFLGSGAVIHALAGEQDLRNMGGLKRDLPVTYWTFLIGALAIAGVPLLSGFFSKDEILFRTFAGGHRVLWTVGVVTSLLTAIYMFRLVYLAFHGPSPSASVTRAGAPSPSAHGGGHGHAAAHGAHGHLHDAPPSMAIPLILLAVGSVVAGYVGVPHALGGGNHIERFLEPSFEVSERERSVRLEADTAADAHPEQTGAHGNAAGEPAAAGVDEGTELTLMGISSGIALFGIGLATFFFLKRRDRADAVARALPGPYRVLLNKYYVDEIYDAVLVQPIKRISTVALWRGIDAGLIDGTVNGAGAVIRGSSAVLRRLQTGSMRTYAASLFLGVVAILGYYLWW